MRDEAKTKAQLIRALTELRQENTALKTTVTEYKQMEEALRQSEARFRAVWEIAADALVLSDSEGIVLAANPAYFRLYGYSEEEVIGRSFALIFSEERRGWAIEGYKATFAAPVIPSNFEAIIYRGDGTERIVETRIDFVTQNGQRIAMLSIIRDITERKQAEAALQQRNRGLALLNRASRAFNSSLDLGEVLVTILEEVRPLLGVVGASIWLNDSQTGELVCHQASGVHNETLQGWRLQPGEGIAGWVAQHGQSQIVPDVQADARHFKYIEQEIGLELHSILCVPLQSKLTVIGVLEVVDTTADRFSQTDLTLVESLAATATIAIENARLYEQTRGDAKISAVLLEEVNHRVKNNLAAIIGLLHLEQRHIEAESQTIDQTVMQDLINRIHGLATAHRLLSTANWSPILLSELTTKVIHSALQALPLDKYVSVKVSPSSIQIAPKLANTLALVITELTTNTVKYAWPEAETGHIAVRLDTKDDDVLLEFRDDGPGFPEEVLRLERHSVGWELIQTLVRHGLRGEITLHNDQGAVTTIRFHPFI
jgi:PAS domain S-box-containing protein